MESHILEINLISAQGLKPPSSKLGRWKTYAVAWVDPSTRLRTRVDRVGSENPTWNDKFLFRVTPEFASSDTSGVSVEIFAVGYVRDHLIGSARLLLSNFLTSSSSSPFAAVQIRRPSGRFQGVLNAAVSLAHRSDFPSLLDGVWAVGHKDLMGGGHHRRDSSDECSDAGSTTTSSASTSPVRSAGAALREWNGPPPPRPTPNLLCGLLAQNRMGLCAFHHGPGMD